MPAEGATDILPFRRIWVVVFAQALFVIGFRIMRFNLVDRILEIETGRRIRVVKNLTLAEEYLADHFPTFPVMPGVMMLQTLVEAGAWLLRVSENFRHSVIVLREAKNVKYGNFIEPGKNLVASAELVESSEEVAVFKGKGEVDGNSTVSARLTLARYNLRDRYPALQAADVRIVNHLRDQYALLTCDGPREAYGEQA